MNQFRVGETSFLPVFLMITPQESDSSDRPLAQDGPVSTDNRLELAVARLECGRPKVGGINAYQRFRKA
jgi:hypothetical protein